MKPRCVRKYRRVGDRPHPNLAEGCGGSKFSGSRSSFRVAHKKRLCLLCHYCGYTPEKVILEKNALCPKCGKSWWERTEILERLIPESGSAMLD